MFRPCLCSLKPICASLGLLLLTSCGGGGDSPSGSQDIPADIKIEWAESGSLEGSFIFSTASSTEDRDELVRYDIASGSHTVISPDFIDGGKIAVIRVSPDKKKIAYVADQVVDNKYEMFVSNSDGSINARLELENQQGHVGSVTWSADSNSFTFRDENKFYLVSFEDGYLNVEKAVMLSENDSISDPDWDVIASNSNGDTIYRQTIEEGSTTTNILAYSSNASTDKTIFYQSSNFVRVTGLSDSGEYFLFVDDPHIGLSKFFSYSLSTQTLVELPVSGRSWGQSWAPNSHEFIFMSMPELESGEHYDLKVFNVETLTERLLLDGTNDFWYFNQAKWKDDQYFLYVTQQTTIVDDLYIADIVNNQVTPMSSILNYDQPVDSYAISNGNRLLIHLDSNPSRTIVTDISGSSAEYIEQYLDLGGRVYGFEWYGEESLIIRYYETSIRDRIYYFLDLQTKSGAKIFGSANNDQGIKCFVNVDHGSKGCSTFYDER